MQYQALDILADVRNSRKWVVVVCPDKVEVKSFNRTLSALISPYDKFSGRTVLCEDGGRLSVVCLEDEPFVEKGCPFTLKFVGPWGKDQTATNPRIKIWLAAANPS